MKTAAFILLGLLAAAYLLGCAALYFGQEKLLFYPRPLPAGYPFTFPGRWREYPVPVADGTQLSGLLFQAAAPARGLVFFLHGNTGSLAEWGALAPVYTRLGYDVFLLDYRGYGKSPGGIGSQAQLLADAEAAYNNLQTSYPESRVVIAGYSLGTGPATWLAARHHPRLLLLHAPYYSLADLAARTVPLWPVLPGFILRYPLPTHEWLPRVAAPVVLVHGQRDALIPYHSSQRLLALGKLADQLITLPSAGHNGLLDDPQYLPAVGPLLLGAVPGK